jgi:hypothetical protein
MPLITSKSAQEIRAESLRKPSKRESPTIGIPEAQEAEVTVVPAPPMPAPEIWAEFEAVVQDLPADDHEPAVNDDHDISYDTTQKAGHAEEELYHTHTLNDDNVNTHGRWTEHLGLSSFPDDPQSRMTPGSATFSILSLSAISNHRLPSERGGICNPSPTHLDVLPALKDGDSNNTAHVAFETENTRHFPFCRVATIWFALRSSLATCYG